MPKTKRLTLQQRIEKQAIEKLVVKSYSVAELAEALGQNYYTVRKCIKRLEDSGLLKGTSHRGNVVIYSLITPDASKPNNSIPVGKGTSGPIKLTALLDLVGKEDKSATGIAAVALPRNAARLFMAALRYVDSNGTYNIDKNLNNIRLELETNLTQLRNMVALYETVLQADVFWDPFKIKAIPYDEAFDREQVVEAYRHYYPED